MAKERRNKPHAVGSIQRELFTVTLTNSHILQDPGPDRIHYLEGLVAKQLDLYNWCEEKVSTLATIDSILLGAATLFVEKIITIDEVTSLFDKILCFALIASVLLPLMISLAIALWHIRPKMGKSSNVGKPNHRSSNGIRHFDNADDYRHKLYSLSDDEICEDLIKQIYGMNKNIWVNQKSIKCAVFLDLIGLIGFLVMIMYWAHGAIF